MSHDLVVTFVMMTLTNILYVLCLDCRVLCSFDPYERVIVANVRKLQKKMHSDLYAVEEIE